MSKPQSSSRTPLQIYARPGVHMGRQLAGDLGFLVWLVVWVIVARFVKHAIDALANPALDLVKAAQQVASTSGSAADQVQTVPGVGSTIAGPFRSLQQQVGALSTSAQNQVTTIHHVSWCMAILSWLVPVAVVAWYWLPRRVRFVREATAARRLLDSEGDLDLFALRAMANLPLAELGRISDDPVAAWRAGDRQVIEWLAARELQRTGVEVRLRRRGRVKGQVGGQGSGRVGGRALSGATVEESQDQE